MSSLNDVSWDDLRTLLVLVREGSIRSAAARLNLSHSTMSRRIASLEQQIGSALIVRTDSGVELTPMGVRAHEIAALMEQRFARMSLLAESVQNERGLVHCAMSEALGTYWVLPRLRQFQAQNPNTIVRLTCGASSTQVMRLEADIAVEYAQPTRPELICVKLATIHFCFYASQDYLRRAGRPRSLADLAQHSLVEQVSSQAKSGFLSNELRNLGLEDRIVFMANTSSAHYNAIDCGLGIGMLPTYATPLGTDLEGLDLDFHFSAPIWLSYHPDHRGNANVMAFVAWLRRLFDPALHPCFGDAFVPPHELRRRPSPLEPGPVNIVAHGGRFAPAEP